VESNLRPKYQAWEKLAESSVTRLGNIFPLGLLWAAFCSTNFSKRFDVDVLNFQKWFDAEVLGFQIGCCCTHFAKFWLLFETLGKIFLGILVALAESL
jgi:hypothetical protein